MRIGKLFCTLIVIALVVGAGPQAVAKQDTAKPARARIGYFAFDPAKFDTFIDGEPTALGFGFPNGAWMNLCIPDFSFMRCSTATQFFAFPSGTHSFAFVPQGQGLKAAVLGPTDVKFEANHAYSLAITGTVEDKSLKLTVIDETKTFAGIDPQTNFMIIEVNGLKGIPTITTVFNNKSERVEYGKVWSASLPGDTQSTMQWNTSETPVNALMSLPGIDDPAGISDLGAVTGSFAGMPPKDVHLIWNWGYPGEITNIDGGTIKVGDTIAGQVAKPAQRVRYTLKLDSTAKLNVYAKMAGKRTTFTDHGAVQFDPVLYVYDAKGIPRYWNDDLVFNTEGSVELFSSGLEGITLQAGAYTLEVGGSPDIVAGPFTLSVEAVKSS